MNSRLPRGLICFLVAVCVLPDVCRADVIISDLGGIYGSGYFVGSSGENKSVASAFTMTSSYSLTDAQLVLQTIDSNVSLALYSNSSGLPGSLLATFNNPTFTTGNTAPVMTYDFKLTTPYVLQAGTTYWIDLASTSAPGGTSEGALWLLSGSSLSGSGATDAGFARDTVNNPPTNFEGKPSTLAYELDGTPASATPAPSTLTMSSILLGMFGVVALRKRMGQAAAA